MSGSNTGLIHFYVNKSYSSNFSQRYNNNLYSPKSLSNIQHEIYITYAQNSRRCFETNYNISDLKVIIHQFWVKKIFPWKFNLEYGSTFTKLFIHVSSRNMFPITRNLQIRVHVYRPRHYCGDWLTFGRFVPMIADHNLVKKSFGPKIADHDLVKKR
jgi:hypothetical protein